MYSYEQRQRAIDLYFEKGRTVLWILDELGYPSKGTLVGWLRTDPRWEAERDRRLAERTYSEDTKLKAIEMRRAGMSRREVKRALGLGSAAVIYTWERRYGLPADAGGRERERKAEVTMSPDVEEAGATDSVDELREQLRRARIENMVLREALDVLKADGRYGAADLTNAEKARVARRLEGSAPLADVLSCLRLKRSTYYYHRGRMAAADKYARARDKLREIFEEGGRVWGYRVMNAKLRALDEPIVVSEKVVRRLMREEGLRVIYDGKRMSRYSSYRGEADGAPPNLVGQDFAAGLPNFLWLTDITEFSIPAGKVYLSPVVDCFDGMLPAWRIGTSPNAELADGMLRDACATLSEGERPVIHDDRGWHYRRQGWYDICDEHGLVRSMSRKGCSPDNSACEGLFGRLKNEFFYYRDWTGVTIEEFIGRLDAWLHYYNDERIKESLGWMSPLEYRRSLGLAA